MSRLVVVSNRVGPVRGAPLAGGLAVAIVDALRERQGLWFGWSGQVAEGDAGPVQLEEQDGMTLAMLDLTRAEHDDYYCGFANRCLWPLFHFRIDLTSFVQSQFDAYRRVNARFAETLLPLLREDDLIWVHDYHLFTLGTELRRLGARQRIGYFLHIPFPPREILATLPRHQELIRGLFAYDLVGLQTKHDVDRMRSYVREEAGGSESRAQMTAFGRTIAVGAFPVGIDAERFRRFAHSADGAREFQRLRDYLRGRDQIIGVDRLDYTKGLLRRMSAYESLLDQHPDTRGRIEYLQIAPISRGEVQAYSDFRRELEQSAAHINGRFAQLDWTPVRYLNRPIPRRKLAGIFRASRIGLVTPMRDGMNLVAKEYVAAQDPDDPGVLVLSRFAGAALQMGSALLVNPYDVGEVAGALQRARTMTLAERRERHLHLWQGLLAFNADHWQKSFIDALAGQPMERVFGEPPTDRLPLAESA